MLLVLVPNEYINPALLPPSMWMHYDDDDDDRHIIRALLLCFKLWMEMSVSLESE